jgi:hypothetical protein
MAKFGGELHRYDGASLCCLLVALRRVLLTSTVALLLKWGSDFDKLFSYICFAFLFTSGRLWEVLFVG